MLAVVGVGEDGVAVLVQVAEDVPADGGVAERCLAAIWAAGDAADEHPFVVVPEAQGDAAGDAVRAGKGLDEDVADGQGRHDERGVAEWVAAAVVVVVGKEVVAQGAVVGAFDEAVHGGVIR